MRKNFLILFFILLANEVSASIKENIIYNLRNIENIAFKFEQNINGKTENGECIIQYPKKIFCKYDLKNEKILVSNGKSLVIKSLSSYYLYPLDKTPLNLILDKNFLINKIDKSDGRIIENKFINYSFSEKNNEINIFFDKNSFEFIGWQTLDIYQNLSITFISSIIKNQKIKKNLFKIPKQN
tara:strand:- start:501 stop:1049 length:549 start_codon:yes stop_codon:yes gene_type:complete